jgi:hypothetical protein
MPDAEPHIIIQGASLTNAQAMTLRVALGHFMIDLGNDDFRRDLGEIGPLYRERACEIAALMALTDKMVQRLERVDASLARRLSECWQENNQLRKRIAELSNPEQ